MILWENGFITNNELDGIVYMVGGFFLVREVYRSNRE